MMNPQCLDGGTRLSQESWVSELRPRCPRVLAQEQSPVEPDMVEGSEALSTHGFPEPLLSRHRAVTSPRADEDETFSTGKAISSLGNGADLEMKK